jgi:hypothetical protein
MMIVATGTVSAHQLLPTYPVFETSFVEGVRVTKLELFNKRQDVKYYELGVFTGDWKPVAFASENKLILSNYLETKRINVYVRDRDVRNVVYICTESKLGRDNTQNTLVSSRVCSKIRHETSN